MDNEICPKKLTHLSDSCMIETDSLAAVRLITLDCSSNHPLFGVVQDIKQLLNHCDYTLSHIRREANLVADSFAKFGLSLSICTMFDSLPAFASLAFQADCIGGVMPQGLV